MGPPTLWQQRQLAKDPLSPVLDGRLVGKSRTSEVSARSMPPWDFRFFVVSSYVTMRNAGTVGLILTVLNHFRLFPSGPLAQSAEGGTGATYFVAQSKRGWPISPRWFLAGASEVASW